MTLVWSCHWWNELDIQSCTITAKQNVTNSDSCVLCPCSPARLLSQGDLARTSFSGPFLAVLVLRKTPLSPQDQGWIPLLQRMFASSGSALRRLIFTSNGNMEHVFHSKSYIKAQEVVVIRRKCTRISTITLINEKYENSTVITSHNTHKVTTHWNVIDSRPVNHYHAIGEEVLRSFIQVKVPLQHLQFKDMNSKVTMIYL